MNGIVGESVCVIIISYMSNDRPSFNSSLLRNKEEEEKEKQYARY